MRSPDPPQKVNDDPAPGFGFVAAAGELQATGMVVSLTKSVILASGAGARAALRRATRAFEIQVAIHVKDLGWMTP